MLSVHVRVKRKVFKSLPDPQFMVIHSIIKDKNSFQNCLYCREPMPKEGWVSDFDFKSHYKSLSCDACGRTNHIKVDFMGSGHDNVGNLEKKLKK